MMYLAVSEDNIPKAESLVAKVGKDYADSAMFAVATGDSALVKRLLGQARDSANVGLVLNALWQVGQWLEQPALAEPFGRIAAGRPEQAARANVSLAENLIIQGRWRAADSAFVRAMATANTPYPRLERGVTAALPFLQVPRQELQAISADLKELRAKSDKLGKPSPDEEKRLRDKYQPQVKELTPKLFSEMMRVAMDPKLGPIVKDSLPNESPAASGPLGM